MSQPPSPGVPQQPNHPFQPGPPGYGSVPPQGAYQGPWPSQVPSGTFPGMPAVGIERPLTLKLAFWFLVASTLVPLAGIPAVLDWMRVYMHEILAITAARSGRATPAGLADQIASMMTPMVWISAAAGVAITVLMAFGVRAGMNWVRILVTVFAGLTLLSYASSFLALAFAAGLPGQVMYPLPAVTYIASYTGGALYVAAAVMSWLRPSSIYIAARRAAKLGGGYLR